MGEIMKLVCLVVIGMVAAAPHADAVISCGQVLSSVSSCLAYLQGGGVVAPSCCDGVRSLYKAAATKADRQAVCGCVKSLASRVGAKTESVNGVITNCGIPISYRYSPSLDCSKVY